MLSVLIPIYNFDVNQLVSDLLHQCQNENIEFETKKHRVKKASKHKLHRT